MFILGLGYSANAEHNYKSPNLVTKIWNGSISNDFENADNWTPTGVPDNDDNIEIVVTANDPVLLEKVGTIFRRTVEGVSIAVGATLTVEDGNNLVSTGTNVPASFQIAGSLINNGILEAGNGINDEFNIICSGNLINNGTIHADSGDNDEVNVSCQGSIINNGEMYIDNGQFGLWILDGSFENHGALEINSILPHQSIVLQGTSSSYNNMPCSYLVLEYVLGVDHEDQTFTNNGYFEYQQEVFFDFSPANFSDNGFQFDPFNSIVDDNTTNLPQFMSFDEFRSDDNSDGLLFCDGGVDPSCMFSRSLSGNITSATYIAESFIEADGRIDEPHNVIFSAYETFLRPNFEVFEGTLEVNNDGCTTHGISLGFTSLIISEEGATQIPITVTLTTQPTSDVTVMISNSHPEDATINMTNLTFTSANWNQSQEILVTAIDDALQEGDELFEIMFVSSSADLNHNNQMISIELTVVDND